MGIHWILSGASPVVPYSLRLAVHLVGRQLCHISSDRRVERHKGSRAGRFDVGHARILDRVGSHDQCRTHRRPFRRDSISGTNPSVGPDTRCKIDGDLREFRPVRPRAFQFPFPRRPRRHGNEFRNLPDGRRPSLYFRAMRRSLAGHYAARDQQYRRRRVFNGHVI